MNTYEKKLLPLSFFMLCLAFSCSALAGTFPSPCKGESKVTAEGLALAQDWSPEQTKARFESAPCNAVARMAYQTYTIKKPEELSSYYVKIFLGKSDEELIRDRKQYPGDKDIRDAYLARLFEKTEAQIQKSTSKESSPEVKQESPNFEDLVNESQLALLKQSLEQAKSQGLSAEQINALLKQIR